MLEDLLLLPELVSGAELGDLLAQSIARDTMQWVLNPSRRERGSARGMGLG